MRPSIGQTVNDGILPGLNISPWFGTADLELHTIRVGDENGIVVIAIRRLTAIFGRWVEDLCAEKLHSGVNIVDDLVAPRIKGKVMGTGFISIVTSLANRGTKIDSESSAVRIPDSPGSARWVRLLPLWRFHVPASAAQRRKEGVVKGNRHAWVADREVDV